MAGAFQPRLAPPGSFNYQRAYYLAHREAKLEYARERRDIDNQLRRERHAGRPKRATFPYRETREQALQIVARGEPKCVSCGTVDRRILCINHLNADGNAERRELAGKTFFVAIVKGERPTNDLDIRCHNCNILYEYEIGRRK